MEKFSKWRDPGTGIHPFIPIPNRDEDNPFKKYAISPILIAIRLLVVPVIFLAWFALETILTVTPGLGLLRSFINRLMGGCALLSMGFYRIPKESFALRRRLANSSSNPSSSNPSSSTLSPQQPAQQSFSPNRRNLTSNAAAGSRPSSTTAPGLKGSDLIISNHSSYIDIIYLQTLFCPVFLRSSVEKPALFEPISFWQALSDCLNHRIVEKCDESKCKPLVEILGDAKSCYVLFIEGTTANGKGLLKAIDCFPGLTLKDSKNLKIRFHLYGLKYEANYASPTFSAGSWMKHLALVIFSQIAHSLSVKFMEYDQLYEFLASNSNEKELLLSQCIPSMLSLLCRLKMTSVIAFSDKPSFLTFFNDKK